MAGEFLANGLINGSLIALVALGFALVYNTIRVFHIAYAGIYLWAGYVMWFFSTRLHWPLVLAVLMAIFASSILGILIQGLVYRPLMGKGRTQDASMISSLGVLIFLVSLVELLFGNSPLYLDFEPGRTIFGHGFPVTAFRIYQFLAGITAISAFYLLLKYTHLGINIRALRDNEILSRLHGVDTRAVRLLLYVLSGTMVGLAASLGALDVGINPHLGIPVFINAFVALVIGGVGRFDGPVAGGIILGLLQSMTEYFFDSRWMMMVTFIVLIIFLAIKPKGLFPERTRAF